jgi:hypothetical protein
MRLIPIAAAAALCVSGAAQAATWHTTEVRGLACGVSVFKTDVIPRQAKIQRIRVFANGGELSGEAVSSLRAQWIGRRAAVTISVRKEAGPATFRVANLRAFGCTRFRGVIRWYSD